MVSKYLFVMRILYCYIGSLDAQDLKWKQMITGLSIVQASNEGLCLLEGILHVIRVYLLIFLINIYWGVKSFNSL